MGRLDFLAGSAFQTLFLAMVNEFFGPVNLWAYFGGSLIAIAIVIWWDGRADRKRIQERTDALTRRILADRKGKI